MNNISKVLFLLLLSCFLTTCKKDEEQRDELVKDRGLGLLPTPQAELEMIPIIDTTVLFAGKRSLSLPDSFSLSMPPIKSQGGEGSCVAFATGYAARSYHLHRDVNHSYMSGGVLDNLKVFSPEYIYNSAKVSGACETAGMHIPTALQLLVDEGVCSWSKMPYSSTDGCATLPSILQKADAAQFKIESFGRINNITSDYLKAIIHHNQPIIFAAKLDDGFWRDGEFIWSNRNGSDIGNHAMVLTGWNDSKNAFQIMNSWGTSWGYDGFGWIDYEYFKSVVLGNYEVYVIQTSDDSGTSIIADFTASKISIAVGEAVNFIDLSTGGSTAWQWTFPGASPLSSTQQSPSGIVYNSAGSYDVTLVASNATASDTETKVGYIVVSEPDAPPIANFSASATSINIGASIDFTDLSANNPTYWEWTFSGGIPTFSSQRNPSGIVYSVAGTYDVVLTVTNVEGSDTETKTGYITVTSSTNGIPCAGIPTVTDIDGNVYNTVQIGNQCWIRENLKTTKFRNGTPIVLAEIWADWYNDSLGAYCWYDNDITNRDIYGALYTLDAVNNSAGLCPQGWHVPTDTEWKQLEMELGMSQLQADSAGWRGTDEGGKLKSIFLWNAPNTGATNISGFSAVPSGVRSTNFFGLGDESRLWSSKEGVIKGGHKILSGSNSKIYRYVHSSATLRDRNGLACRCIRD